jgi:RNA polymerase sigma factor, sigma-70 family
LSDIPLLVCLIIRNLEIMDAAPAKELYEKYGFLIYRTCVNILHSEDDAKDALQTVFLKLLECYSTIRDPEKVVTWIFNAAKNHCFNQLRFQKKFNNAVEVQDTEYVDGFDERISNKELIRLIFKNHGKKVRDAVYFTYVEKFDQQEIRKLTGQSPATIRRNLHRFKKSIPFIEKRLAENI